MSQLLTYNRLDLLLLAGLWNTSAEVIQSRLIKWKDLSDAYHFANYEFHWITRIHIGYLSKISYYESIARFLRVLYTRK